MNAGPIGIGGEVVLEPDWYYEEDYGDGPFAAGWMSEEEARSFIASAADRYAAEILAIVDGREG